MRLANRQRQDQVAAEVYGLSLTTDRIEALHTIFALPDNADPDRVLETPDTPKAAHISQRDWRPEPAGPGCAPPGCRPIALTPLRIPRMSPAGRLPKSEVSSRKFSIHHKGV